MAGNEQEAARLVARVVADVSNYERDMKRADQITRDTARSMSGQLTPASTAGSRAMSLLGAAAGAAAGAFSLVKVRDMAIELSNLATQATNIGTAFEQNISGTATDALQRLRDASRGEITDMDLMLNANRAALLGVTRDAEQLADLLEAARARGAAMGLSTAQAFNDIVTGIGRMSPLILDNLGILTGGEEGYARYAASIGKAADELSDFEKKQYLLNKVLSETEGVVTPAANSIASMDAATANLKTSFAQSAMAGSIGTAWQDATGWVAQATQATAGYFARISEGRGEVDAFYERMVRMRDAGALSEKQFRGMESGLRAVSAATDWGTLSSDQLAAALQRIANVTPEVAAAWADWEMRIHSVDSATSEVQARLEQMDQRTYIATLQVNIQSNGVALEDTSLGSGFYDWAQDPIVSGKVARGRDPNVIKNAYSEAARFAEDLTDAQFRYNMATRDTGGQLDLLRGRLGEVNQGSAEYYDLLTQIANLENKGASSSARAVASAYDEQARAAEQAIDDMRGRIDRAFASSSVSDRDWWETNLGVYQDKPDEYLRRLRSAVEDANSEWKDLLGGRGGDEAKLYLAQQEDAWRSGQWGQLGPGFDAEASTAAIKEQVRREIEAERSRQAIIESILNDPDMLGMGLSQGEMARAMGVENYQASGADAVQQMVAGAASTDFGAEITATITAQFRAKTSEWQAIGKAMMEAFLTGSTGAISPMTMDAFAATMWPELAPRVQQVVAGGYPG